MNLDCLVNLKFKYRVVDSDVNDRYNVIREDEVPIAKYLTLRNAETISAALNALSIDEAMYSSLCTVISDMWHSLTREGAPNSLLIKWRSMLLYYSNIAIINRKSLNKLDNLGSFIINIKKVIDTSEDSELKNTLLSLFDSWEENINYDTLNSYTGIVPTTLDQVTESIEEILEAINGGTDETQGD